MLNNFLDVLLYLTCLHFIQAQTVPEPQQKYFWWDQIAGDLNRRELRGDKDGFWAVRGKRSGGRAGEILVAGAGEGFLGGAGEGLVGGAEKGLMQRRPDAKDKDDTIYVDAEDYKYLNLLQQFLEEFGDLKEFHDGAEENEVMKRFLKPNGLFTSVQMKRSHFKPNGLFGAINGKRAGGMAKPNGLFISLPGKCDEGPILKRPSKPNGLFSLSGKRSALKPNGLFSVHGKRSLKPNGLFVLKRRMIKPNGLFGAFKRGGIKPNGLFSSFKRSNTEEEAMEFYDDENEDLENLEEPGYKMEKKDDQSFWAVRGKKDDDFWAVRGKRSNDDFWAVRGKKDAETVDAASIATQLSHQD